jgi:hypothetical protein
MKGRLLPSGFKEAREELLAACGIELNMTRFAVEREYRENPEFKRRIDIAALNLSQPENETLH